MISRLCSLALTLAVVVVACQIIGQSQKLALLRSQVNVLERQVGSWRLPDDEKIWIQPIAARPGNFAWRLLVPPIKAFDICEAVPQADGQLELYSMFNYADQQLLPQQTIVRFSRTSLGQYGSLYLTAFDNLAAALEYTRGPVRVPLSPEVFDIRILHEQEKAFELDEPVPLLEYRVKQQWIDSKLAEGVLNADQAQYLATPHVWYFGTPQAMTALRKTVPTSRNAPDQVPGN